MTALTCQGRVGEALERVRRQDAIYGTMRGGKREGLITWIRSSKPSTEKTIPPYAAKNVWLAKQTYFPDDTCDAVFYFDRDGDEVDLAGQPVVRPASVPESAFRTEVDGEIRWLDGRQSLGESKRVGVWRTYDAEGTLVESDTPSE